MLQSMGSQRVMTERLNRTELKTCKQPKSPSMVKGFFFLNVVYIYTPYTMDYFSTIEKETLSFATTGMELERIMLRELRKKKILSDLAYM